MITNVPGLKRVLPLALPSVYIPAKPLPSSFYPATLFLLQVKNANSWKTDYESISFNSFWTAALKNYMGADGFKYWKQPANGQWFPENKPDHLRLCVFPKNLLNITQVLYRAGEYWGQVQTVKLTTFPPNFYQLPFYQMAYQYDQNSLGQVIGCQADKGKLVSFPIVAAHPVWIQMSNLEDA
jgi:hypothetical protein